MRVLIIALAMLLSACGTTREQLAEGKAAEIISTMQSTGHLRLMQPAERDSIQHWLALRLLNWEK